MDRPTLNRLNRERRIDPVSALKKLRAIENELASAHVKEKVRTLRTNGLKRDREIRAACLFAHGMSCRFGEPFWVYPVEDADYDFLLGRDDPPLRHFSPVQLKEVVPAHLNPNASLQEVVNGLPEYRDSPNLSVAIYFNRAEAFKPAGLCIPALSVASLWVFGATSPVGSDWFLYGNLIEEPGYSAFGYPDD